MSSVIVLGLDGASFQLLDTWIDEGLCPNLGQLVEDGVAAPLQSSLPPVTCPAWRCYSTGVNPGKHGVFWWEQVNRETRSLGVPDSGSFDAPDIWDYLGEEGLTSGVVNMPTTHPPEPLEGYMISGGGGTDTGDYTYPDTLEAEIESRFNYQAFSDIPTSEIGENPEHVETVLNLIDTRFDVASYIKETYAPDFLHLTIFYTNVFHHFFWDGEPTRRVWRRVDENLGSFLNDDDTVLIMSDHGTNEIQTTFNINTWLSNRGDLTTTETVSDVFNRLRLTKDRLATLATTLGVKPLLKRMLSKRFVGLFPSEDGGVTGSGKENKIDWERSTVVASGQGPIYILSDSKRRGEFRTELRNELEAVRAPDGSPIFKSVKFAEKVYSGPYVDAGPDLVVEQADNVYVSGAVGLESLFERPNDWRAENHRDGIFIANGPEVDSDSDLERQPLIYDLAPTILHWFGQAVPERLDGRVLTEIFTDDSEPRNRSVTFEQRDGLEKRSDDGEGSEEEMRRRLQDLGYLSE